MEPMGIGVLRKRIEPFRVFWAWIVNPGSLKLPGIVSGFFGRLRKVQRKGTHRLHGSSFSGLPYRILNIDP